MDGDAKKKPDESPEIETGETTIDEAELTLLDEIDSGISAVGAGVKTALVQPGCSPSEDSAAAKMDLFDARPTLAFVEENLKAFETGVFRLARGGFNSNRKFIQRISFENFEQAEGQESPAASCQIPVIRLKQILFSLPPSLFALSSLKEVSWKDDTPVPVFSSGGEPQGEEKWVAEQDFIDGKTHPSRIYVGKTDFFQDNAGKIASRILLTRIPKSVSENPTAVFNYQVYTLLHEFMHTVLNLIIHQQKARDYILDLDTPAVRSDVGIKDKAAYRARLKQQMIFGRAKTLQQWMEEFRNTIIDGTEPILTSDYAEAAAKELQCPDPEVYTPALIELICETFAAYLIDIMPNKHGYKSFSGASFGNREFERESKTQSGCRTERFRLIKELCESAIIRSNK